MHAKSYFWHVSDVWHCSSHPVYSASYHYSLHSKFCYCEVSKGCLFFLRTRSVVGNRCLKQMQISNNFAETAHENVLVIKYVYWPRIDHQWMSPCNIWRCHIPSWWHYCYIALIVNGPSTSQQLPVCRACSHVECPRVH